MNKKELQELDYTLDIKTVRNLLSIYMIEEFRLIEQIKKLENERRLKQIVCNSMKEMYLILKTEDE